MADCDTRFLSVFWLALASRWLLVGVSWLRLQFMLEVSSWAVPPLFSSIWRTLRNCICWYNCWTGISGWVKGIGLPVAIERGMGCMNMS